MWENKVTERRNNMIRELYERVRALIIWLGLGELAWIGYWLLNPDDTTPGYMATAVGWLGCWPGWLL